MQAALEQTVAKVLADQLHRDRLLEETLLRLFQHVAEQVQDQHLVADREIRSQASVARPFLLLVIVELLAYV